jgi:hypothetical protein
MPSFHRRMQLPPSLLDSLGAGVGADARAVCKDLAEAGFVEAGAGLKRKPATAFRFAGRLDLAAECWIT